MFGYLTDRTFLESFWIECINSHTLRFVIRLKYGLKNNIFCFIYCHNQPYGNRETLDFKNIVYNREI